MTGAKWIVQASKSLSKGPFASTNEFPSLANSFFRKVEEAIIPMQRSNTALQISKEDTVMTVQIAHNSAFVLQSNAIKTELTLQSPVRFLKRTCKNKEIRYGVDFWCEILSL